ncbi:MAG: hypothetical protein U9O94_00060, partial [Nanoarchaeota archaeon]|nr:hypothetical protein [Nanoarchaeota archaeon]
ETNDPYSELELAIEAFEEQMSTNSRKYTHNYLRPQKDPFSNTEPTKDLLQLAEGVPLTKENLRTIDLDEAEALKEMYDLLHKHNTLGNVIPIVHNGHIETIVFKDFLFKYDHFHIHSWEKREVKPLSHLENLFFDSTLDEGQFIGSYGENVRKIIVQDSRYRVDKYLGRGPHNYFVHLQLDVPKLETLELINSNNICWNEFENCLRLYRDSSSEIKIKMSSHKEHVFAYSVLFNHNNKAIDITINGKTAEDIINSHHFLKFLIIGNEESWTKAYEKYKSFMTKLGFEENLGYIQDDIYNCEHIEERYNEAVSKNPSLFLNILLKTDVEMYPQLWFTDRKFVKFYSDMEDGHNEAHLQSILSRITNGELVNECNFADLRNTNPSILERLQDFHSLKLQSYSQSFSTINYNNSKLSCALVTDRIKFTDLETVLENRDYMMDQELEKIFFDVTDGILELHDKVNKHTTIKKDATAVVRYWHKGAKVKVRDYTESQRTWFNTYMSKGALATTEERREEQEFIGAASVVNTKLNSYRTKKYLSFVNGDMHARNIMFCRYTHKMKFIDWERAAVGLKVEDFTRIYQEAKEMDMERGTDIAENVKQHFFEKAYGKEFYEQNKEELHEMLSLATAQHFMETMPYTYNRMLNEKSEKTRESFRQRLNQHLKITEENLLPYIGQENTAKIINFLRKDNTPKEVSYISPVEPAMLQIA